LGHARKVPISTPVWTGQCLGLNVRAPWPWLPLRRIHLILALMDTLIFRGRPNDRDECDQWTLVRDGEDQEDFVIQEHIKLGAILSGKPYARLIRRMTVEEFLGTDQPPAVKIKLQNILDARNTPMP
jgi:hypothetical protein